MLLRNGTDEAWTSLAPSSSSSGGKQTRAQLVSFPFGRCSSRRASWPELINDWLEASESASERRKEREKEAESNLHAAHTRQDLSTATLIIGFN